MKHSGTKPLRNNNYKITVYDNYDKESRGKLRGLRKVELEIALYRKRKRISMLIYIISAFIISGIGYIGYMINDIHNKVNEVETSMIIIPVMESTKNFQKVSKITSKEYQKPEENIQEEKPEINKIELHTDDITDQPEGKTNEEPVVNNDEVQEQSLDYKPSRDEYEIVECMTLITPSNEIIETGNFKFIKYDLPSKYYQGLDFSSFQPYMSYYKVTDKKSPAYQICHSDMAYTDEYGLRRYKTNENQFTINGQDDYVIALGTFYKEKGVCGERFLIETSNGAYTAITGDEKADKDTDNMNMFTMHSGKAGIIEWIVDERSLNSDIMKGGTVTKGPIDVLNGEILSIYKIEE